MCEHDRDWQKEKLFIFGKLHKLHCFKTIKKLPIQKAATKRHGLLVILLKMHVWNELRQKH
jgi:hypothetical protein